MTDDELMIEYRKAFTDDFNWLGANIPLRLNMEVLTAAKVEYSEQLEKRTPWSRKRIINVVQLKSLLNIELPSLYHSLFALDYDSCFVGPRILLNSMLRNIINVDSEILLKAFHRIATPNTVFALLSNSTINGLLHCINLVIENLVDIVDLQEQSDWDNLNSIEEAIDQLSRQVREEFEEQGHRAFFNAKVAAVVDKYRALVSGE